MPKKPIISSLDQEIAFQNEDANRYAKKNDKLGVATNKIKATVKPPPLPKQDALGSRIEAINKVSNTLMIKNDRIGRNARQNPDRPVKLFSKLDEDMVQEYQKKIPSTFEYIDPNTGETKYRKYLPPNAVPQLEENADFIPESELKRVEGEVQDQIDELLQIIKLETANLQRLNRLQEQTKQQINEGFYGLEEGQTQLDEIMYAIDKKQDRLTEAEQKYNSAIEYKKNIRPNYERYNAEVASLKKRNLQKVNMYRDELNLLNKGAFSTEKADNESEIDYLQRLQRNAELLAPDDELYDAKQATINDFRIKMRELIKDPVIIEQVINALDSNDEDIDNKATLLKEWAVVKRKFISTYGINNPKITASDIITFFNYFLTIGESGLSMAVESEMKSPSETGLNNDGVEVIYEPAYDIAVVVNHATEKSLFFKMATDNTKYYLLYSFTGEEGSFKQYFDSRSNVVYSQKIPADRKQGQKKAGESSSSTREIENKTGLTPIQINKAFNVPNPSSLVLSESKIMKTMRDNNIPAISIVDERVRQIPYASTKNGPIKYTEYGMGLHSAMQGVSTEHIPQYIPFGSVIILMRKLYYNNQLAVRNKHMKTIAGFKTEKVSEPFVKIITNMVKGIQPTHSDITQLSNKERMLYDKLVMLGNLNKSVPHQGDRTVDELKKRLKVIEAEIEIGNNNPMLKQEIYTILHSLKSFKVITQGQIDKYMRQL